MLDTLAKQRQANKGNKVKIKEIDNEIAKAILLIYGENC